jgi:hypothetical protein
MTRAGKSSHQSDLGDGMPSPTQEYPGLFNPSLKDVLMDGYSHHISECSFAVRYAETDYISKFGKRQIASDVVVDV